MTARILWGVVVALIMTSTLFAELFGEEEQAATHLGSPFLYFLA